MRAIMLWISKNPKLSTLIALLVTLLFAVQLHNLKIDTSATGLVVKDAPETQFYAESKKIFGDDNTLTLVYKASNIFQQPILQSIEDLSFETGEIDGVTRVISLSTVNNLRASDDGYLNTDTLLPYVPDSSAEIAKVRDNSLAHELIHGEVINSRGTVAAIQLSIEDRPNDPLFSAELEKKIEKLLIRERAKLGENITLYQVGNITIANAMMDSIYTDVMTITPLALAALVLILFAFFRSGATLLLPVVTGLLSVLVSLGLMALLDFAINPISLIVPALLLIIGATEDIHILAEYELGLRNYQQKQAAIKHMAVRSGLVIFLTSLTTFAGFMTLGPNSIPMISEFGIIAGLGIIANFLITILVAPALLNALPVPKAFKKPETAFLLGTTNFLIRLATTHRKKIFVGSIVFLLSSAGAAFFIKVDSNYLSFFRDDAPIRTLIDDVNQQLSGANAFFVIVDTHRDDGLKKSDNLQAIAKFSDYLAQRYETVVSYDRFIRKTHKEMNDGSDKFFKIPENDALIAQYTLLMQPDTLERFADFDFRKACILVRSDVIGSEQMNKDLAEIQVFVEKELPIRMSVTVTGGSILVAQASDQISREMLLNLAMMLGVIFLVISALFVSLKAGLLAMIPNSLPIIGALGAMGLLGIPLSTGTFPVVIIALGVAVDDTLHFMVQFSKESKRSNDNNRAIAQTIRHEIKPVLGTSLALIVGFSVLMLAEFATIAEFGLLSAITILLALLSDLIITPALLLTVPLITYWDLLRLSISQQVIDTSPLFKGLKPSQIKRFALMGTIEKVSAGELLITQGKHDDAMLLLLKGQLDILVAGDDNNNKKVGRIESGSIVGEMALLSGEARTASVQAVEDVEVLKIDAATLQRVGRRYPKMTIKIHQNISQILVSRLKKTTQDYIRVMD